MSNNRNLGNIATAITNANSGEVLTSQGNGVAAFAAISAGGFDVVNTVSRTLTANTTIAGTENALTVGPLNIASGVTLTIEAGGRHVIV